MAARAALALAALVAIRASAQPAAYVYVRDNDSDPNLNDIDDVERRFTPELRAELRTARDDALLLYAEYTARVGGDMKRFIKELVDIKEEARRGADETLKNAPANCVSQFDVGVGEAVRDARRAATFSAENHHKFLLGHMVVFRMHLNKSEDYINKCDKLLRDCGVACEMMPRAKRLRSNALQEINRVKDDIQHSRKSYKDLVAHATRKLNHLRKHTRARISRAAEDLETCVNM